jgi:hypothetical protein
MIKPNQSFPRRRESILIDAASILMHPRLRSDDGLKCRAKPRRVLAYTLILFIALSVISAPSMGAKEIEGVKFASRYDTGGMAFDLRCVGVMRWMYVIKAYVAALYLGPDVAPKIVLNDVPKRLEINYFYAIAAGDFVKATDITIAANTDAATLARLRPEIDALNSLYRDVQPGDRYALTYVPGRGTELALNGNALGLVPGYDFARAIFSIWLGAKPLDESLKSQLLTCS